VIAAAPAGIRVGYAGGTVLEGSRSNAPMPSWRARQLSGSTGSTSPAVRSTSLLIASPTSSSAAWPPPTVHGAGTCSALLRLSPLRQRQPRRWKSWLMLSRIGYCRSRTGDLRGRRWIGGGVNTRV